MLRLHRNMNTAGWAAFFLLMLVGLRDFVPHLTGLLPPNFMEFNMYVYDIRSRVSGSTYPDIYAYSQKKDDYVLLDAAAINRSMLGFLFQGDRWKRNPELVENYFCSRQQFLPEPPGKAKQRIIVAFLKNNREHVEEQYEFRCD